jgi:tricorn protease
MVRNRFSVRPKLAGAIMRGTRDFLLGVLVVLLVLFSAVPTRAAGPVGYYRQPALHHNTVVFVSEGDLWRVGIGGGAARRLTSHAGDEGLPAISPDGRTVAFTGQYEGPTEIYTMLLSGGRPTRRTCGAGRITFVGWTPDGKVLYGTDAYSTLPSAQLVALEIHGKNTAATPSIVPLAQAAQGVYDDEGKTLYFTRLPFQGSHTKRYKGGTAQNLWKFTAGDAEARPLTTGYPGTSKCPMWWRGRVYFASDRDGTMNLWSMGPDGRDLKQHTRHVGWDVASPSLHGGKIIYQLGADLHLYDIAADTDKTLRITLDSDLDQDREHWVQKPMDYLTSASIAPDGSRVALTARGQVFVAPRRQGRLVEVTRKRGVRYRAARFLPDGKSLLVLSDESGEVELWKLPANGVGPGEQLTRDGRVLRWEGIPSPDGKLIAHRDKNQRLFLYNLERKKNTLIDESKLEDFNNLTWSPDSKWLAYVDRADNMFRRVKLYGVAESKTAFLTSDRFESSSPAWSPDGKWLYLLSDRNLRTVVPSPWGNYQPEPFLDKKTKIYQIALTEGLRSPFAPADELSPDKPDKADKAKNGLKKPSPPPRVRIELAGIERRLIPVPVPPGNYGSLVVNDKGLYWLSAVAGERRRSLVGVPITNIRHDVKPITTDVRSFELSQDGKYLLIQKRQGVFIVDARPAAADLSKAGVNLAGWSLSVVPREEWRQMFAEAWRLERDYFYDQAMHGVDWQGMRKKYAPLVDRVNSRAELADLTAQMVSELSALHIFVRGGDLRRGTDQVMPASLGAVLERDEKAGGYRVRHIYRSNPDEPEEAGPLARPNVNVCEGDVIEMINGTPTLDVADAALLLRNQAGRQVLLRVKPARGGAGRDVIVKPISMKALADLRYHEWEYTRQLRVEKEGKGDMGYVHLRAMGSGNYTEWAKNFYPVFNRQGLIIDVRHNRGGNIDSWILGRLLRKAWFYWSQRVGREPVWNMQYAFRGHVVVLCDEFTASDGEAFTEGIKRLKIGKVIGTRTWGGEIWLSSSNFLVDRGIATAAEMGVFGPEGKWLIEGYGVEPDIVVDNLPHATFQGRDAQLESAIAYLQKRIKEKPIIIPPLPRHPDKAFKARSGLR